MPINCVMPSEMYSQIYPLKWYNISIPNTPKQSLTSPFCLNKLIFSVAVYSVHSLAWYCGAMLQIQVLGLASIGDSLGEKKTINAKAT